MTQTPLRRAEAPRRTLVALIGSACLLLAASAGAETLDFAHCVERALEQNPGLGASRAQIAQAEGALRQAEGGRLPKLNVSVTGMNTNDALNVFGIKLSQRQATFADFGAGQFNPANPNVLSVAPDQLNNPDAVTNYNTRIEVQVPVYNGGMVGGYIDKAKAYVEAARHGDAFARQQLIFHVLQAYEGVHAARAYVKVAEQAQEAAQAYVKTTESLLAQGVVVRSELLSAQVNLQDVKVKLEQARNGEASALDQLHLLLGMPMDAPLDVGADVNLPAPAGTVAALRGEAVEANPGLLALRRQAEGARAGVDVAKAPWLPHFNIMARQDWNASDLALKASSYTVAGVLSWQLFDGGTRGAVDRAAAEQSEVLSRLREAEEGVRFQVGDAWRKAQEAESRVKGRELAVAQAEEAQRLVKKRYDNGVTTMVEVLATQALLDKARADLVAARYERKLQRAALRLALGTLDADLGKGLVPVAEEQTAPVSDKESAPEVRMPAAPNTDDARKGAAGSPVAQNP